MPDAIITQNQFVAVPSPAVASKMQVLDAPVYVTFTAAGTDTRGHRYEPGDVIPVAGANAVRARKADAGPATLVFEVFG